MHPQRQHHRERMMPWVEAHRHRAARGVKHPVYDFLFTYYSFRPNLLLRWSPGVEVTIEREILDWPADFMEHDGGFILPASRFPEHRLSFLNWAIAYQKAILEREANFNCLGLHEWAMAYRTPEVRHAATPLRLASKEIASVVESQGLRCTHYDAFRFFTPEAAPRNRIALTRSNTVEHDQGGCIHANMDLYKFAYTIAPFTTSALLADCFELAARVREIDMRASPYDLRELGFEPIRIEEKPGREEYVNLQRELADAAKPLRIRLIGEYERLRELRSVTPP